MTRRYHHYRRADYVPPAKPAIQPLTDYVWAYASPREAIVTMQSIPAEGPVGFRAWGCVFVERWEFDPSTEALVTLDRPDPALRYRTLAQHRAEVAS